MNSKQKHALASILAISLVFASMAASANKPQNITEAEMAQLPAYCPDTMGFNYGDASFHTSPNAAKWVGMMGKGFWHMHHYCWALITLRRAERATVPPDQKRYQRSEAIGDLRYVVKNTENDFILLPEVYTWIGRTSLLLNQPQEAGIAFAKAQELKPDYWPAYYHWADFLKSKGQKREAMEVVKAGLQHAPGTKPLLLLFGDLGGKPADIPPPIVKQEAVVSPEIPGKTENLPAPAAQEPGQVP